MKDVWTSRVGQVVAKYGENAPAAACCNACRACVTTNILAVATAALAAVGLRARARFARQP